MTSTTKLIALLSLTTMACAQQLSGGPIPQDDTCESCDTLGDVNAEQVCEDRTADLTAQNAAVFQPETLQWSCADVAGINAVGKDDRGTEYCEYFAYLAPGLAKDSDGNPIIPGFGDEVGIAGKITAQRQAVPLSFKDLFGYSLDDNEDVIFGLEDYPDSIVGQCVFTAWNGNDDLDTPEGATLDIFGELKSDGPGLDVSFDMLSLSDPLNRAESAKQLVSDCSVDRTAASSIVHDSCLSLEDMKRENRFLPYSKGNAVLCSAASSLETCGCTPSGGYSMADALIPNDSLELGSWNKELLPAGCRARADSSVVTCDIEAADLLNHQSDIKDFCRSTYGRNVLVQVPVPETSCSPDEIADCGAWYESQ